MESASALLTFCAAEMGLLVSSILQTGTFTAVFGLGSIIFELTKLSKSCFKEGGGGGEVECVKHHCVQGEFHIGLSFS